MRRRHRTRRPPTLGSTRPVGTQTPSPAAAKLARRESAGDPRGTSSHSRGDHPRAGGDGPSRAAFAIRRLRCSPQARGWSRRPNYRPVSREQAIEALAQGGREPCKMCRPDTALGLL
ncbi:DUF6233 domain-containing protein [Streptomyces niveus]|uniref:DUF6233 domain-containing protein n=1 Tax=Streptomyces niveus TaxID=193462 RepID=UPI0036E7F9FF